MGYLNKEEQRLYQKEWVKNRRKKFLRNCKCIKCGTEKFLQVDHIDPKKKVDHRIWSWREERITKELSKCQILCRSCHQKKTNSDNQFKQKNALAC